MAFRVIAAVAGIGIPVDGTIGRDLESRIALLVQILAAVGFDCSRIDGVFGDSHPSRCHEDHRGNHKPVLMQSDCPRRSMTDVPARGATPRAGTISDQLTAAARTP